MPRVEELIIITEFSPWCTIIKNPLGVTLGDICTTLFKECVLTTFLSGRSGLSASSDVLQVLGEDGHGEGVRLAPTSSAGASSKIRFFRHRCRLAAVLLTSGGPDAVPQSW